MAQQRQRAGDPVPVRPRGRVWTAAALLMIVLGSLMAPLAVVSVWGRATLADTDAFVATYAPLMHDAAVRAAVTQEVTAAIVKAIDMEQVTSDLIDSLEPGPRVRRGLEALQGPVVRGVSDLVEGAVGKFIGSEASVNAWSAALRISHVQLGATLSQDPNAWVTAEDGVIGLQIGPIVEAIKKVLLEDGLTLAERIPTVDKTIPLAESGQIPAIRAGYRFILWAGSWLPLLAFGLVAVGVLVARRRRVALAWAGLGLAVSMLALLGAFGIVKSAMLTGTGSAVPADAIRVVFDTATAQMRDTAKILALLGLTVAVAAWLAGPASLARLLRRTYLAGVQRLRGWAERQGVTTGRWGERVHRRRSWVLAVIAAAAAAVVVWVRPLTTGVLVWTALAGLLAVIVVTLVERPPRTGA